jgi:hypothetical protein
MWRRNWISLSVACALVGGGIWAANQDGPAASGQESKAPAKAAEKAPENAAAKRRVRLPAYYAQVVSEEQRAEIYSLLIEYEEQIDALAAQMELLVDERNNKIREVLTPEQRQEVDDRAAAARERRRQSAGKATSGSESPAENEAAEPAESASKKKPAKPAKSE